MAVLLGRAFPHPTKLRSTEVGKIKEASQQEFKLTLIIEKIMSPVNEGYNKPVRNCILRMRQIRERTFP